MGSTTKNQHDASGSLAGYLYQCRLALLLGLETVKRNPNGHISIEQFDDIAFHSDNYPDCIAQVKHHSTPKALTNASVDFWKTFGIWIKDFQNGVISGTEIRRLLITTSTAPEGSALIHLRPGTSAEDRKVALTSLQETARVSTNDETAEGRRAFLGLTNDEAILLLQSIEVLDAYPDLVDVTADIESELRIASPNHADKVAEALEGWWLKAVGKRLLGRGNEPIFLQHILAKAHDISRQFTVDGLPLSNPEEFGNRPYNPLDEDEVYVKQMRLVRLPNNAVERGIRDFYRSSAQRSIWARENLLLDGEAARYDAKLIDRWERKFDQDAGDIDTLSEPDMCKVGRDIYHWANQLEEGFRNVVETWITAGSFHSLSNQTKIGWHPNFRTHFNTQEGQDATS